MAQVTIPGLSGPPVTVTGPQDVLSLARLVANALLLADTAHGGPGVTGSVLGSLASVNSAIAPSVTTEKTELVVHDTVSGSVTVPAGPPNWQYTIIDDNHPVSITANNQVVVTNDTVGSNYYHLIGTATLAAAGGDNFVSVGSGTYQVAMGDGNDTIFATGSGFISPGGGTNVVVSTGSDFIQSTGTNDFIGAFGASTSVDASGSGVSILGLAGDNLFATVSGSDAVVVGNGADVSLLLSSTAGSAEIFGGTGSVPGSLDVTDNGTADTIAAFGAPATVNMAGSGGLLYGSSSDMSATLGGSNNTILGGGGAATVQSQADGVVIGGGNLTFLGGTANSTIFGGGAGSTLAYVGGDGNSTIVGGAGNEIVTMGGGGLLFAPGTGPATITAGAGAATLFGSAGSDVTFNGAGTSLLYAAGAGSETLGGSGSAVVFGGNGSNVTFNGTSLSGSLIAGAGNETLNAAGSSSSNFMVGGADSTSTTSLVGGSGNDTILAGGGADSILTGGGNDIVAFFKAATGGQHDYIQDFNVNKDYLYILGYDSTKSASYLQNNASTVGGGVTLTLSDNTQITFTNLTNANQLNGRILYT